MCIGYRMLLENNRKMGLKSYLKIKSYKNNSSTVLTVIHSSGIENFIFIKEATLTLLLYELFSVTMINILLANLKKKKK